MKNVTQMAQQLNMVGIKSCKHWGFTRLNATRLEHNNGRVQWTVHLHLPGASLSAGVTYG